MLSVWVLSVQSQVWVEVEVRGVLGSVGGLVPIKDESMEGINVADSS